jgi:hypothetical protein
MLLVFQPIFGPSYLSAFSKERRNYGIDARNHVDSYKTRVFVSLSIFRRFYSKINNNNYYFLQCFLVIYFDSVLYCPTM